MTRRALEGFGYHTTPAAALLFPGIGRWLGAALGADYRGGRWFESTAAHRVNALNCVNAYPCNAISWYEVVRRSGLLRLAGAQPGHRFPEPGGSRRTQTDTKARQFEFRRTSADTVGYSRTRHLHGSGP
jgi:hypothetical protein